MRSQPTGDVRKGGGGSECSAEACFVPIKKEGGGWLCPLPALCWDIFHLKIGRFLVLDPKASWGRRGGCPPEGQECQCGQTEFVPQALDNCSFHLQFCSKICCCPNLCILKMLSVECVWNLKYGPCQIPHRAGPHNGHLSMPWGAPLSTAHHTQHKDLIDNLCCPATFIAQGMLSRADGL